MSTEAGASHGDDESRLQLAFDFAHVGLTDWDLTADRVYWRMDRGGEPGGVTETTSSREAWENRVHPQDRERVRASLRAALESPWPDFAAEFRFQVSDADYRWLLAHGKVIRDCAGVPNRMIGTFLDITERKLAEAFGNESNQILELIAAGRPLAETLTALLHLMEAQLPGKLCSIPLLDADGVHLHHGAPPSLPEEYLRAVDNRAIGHFVGPCGMAAFRREPVYVEDIATAALPARYRAAALPHGLRACWSTPIFDAQQRVLGVFAIYSREPCLPNAQHLRLIDRATHIASIAIGKARAEKSLLESERTTRSTLDALPANLCVVDKRGTILSVNESWSRFAQENGVDPQAVGVGCNYLEVCRHAAGPSSEEAPSFAEKLDAVLKGALDEFEMDYPCHSPDEKRWFTGRVTRFPGEGPVRAVILHINITERKLAETALREREHFLSESQRIAHIGSWSWDLKGPIVWTDETYRIYGISPETFTPTVESQCSLVHPEDRPAMQRWVEALAAGEKPADLEYRAIQPDGSVRVLSGRGELLYDAASNTALMAGTVQDITERVRAGLALREQTARLRELTRRLMEIDEQNRRQLGVELHDRLGPNLSAMLLSLGMIRNKLPLKAQRELASHFDDCAALLNEAMAQVRDVLADLRPPALHDLGLVAALTHLARQVATRSGIDFNVTGREPSPRLPAASEIALYRIAQEALNNVAKHAQATLVSLSMRTQARSVVLTIADNGKGFDPAVRPPTGSSLGMTTMRERAEAIDGSLAVESAPSKGTRVIAEAPREKKRDDER